MRHRASTPLWINPKLHFHNTKMSYATIRIFHILMQSSRNGSNLSFPRLSPTFPRFCRFPVSAFVSPTFPARLFSSLNPYPRNHRNHESQSEKDEVKQRKLKPLISRTICCRWSHTSRKTLCGGRWRGNHVKVRGTNHIRLHHWLRFLFSAQNQCPRRQIPWQSQDISSHHLSLSSRSCFGRLGRETQFFAFHRFHSCKRHKISTTHAT